MPVSKQPSITIDVIEVRRGEATYRVVGETPLIQERMSEKAKRELLMPRGRLNAAAKATNLKHNPRDEFLASAYVSDDGPTKIVMPATAFKNAIRTAALDLAGTNKAVIGRLTYVVGDMVPIWGIPQIVMSGVRSADMAKTPDIRTRPILPRWATEITVRFVEPNLTANAISRLLVAAGMFCGVGGWRQEKGSGSFGLFRPVQDEDVALFEDLTANEGRAAQEAALADPIPYDATTDELLSWFEQELGVRRLRGSSAAA